MMVLLFPFSHLHLIATKKKKKICAHCQIKCLFSLWKVVTSVSSILHWCYSVGIPMSRSAPSHVMCCTRFTVCAQGMSSNTHRFVERLGVLLPWLTWRLLSAGCINRRLHPRLRADGCACPSEKDPSPPYRRKA